MTERCDSALLRTGLIVTVGRVEARILVCVGCGRTLIASDAADMRTCDEDPPHVVIVNGTRVECDTPDEALRLREMLDG